MTQTTFARRLRCHDTAVSQWLSGRTRPTYEYLAAIQRMTGIPYERLINDLLEVKTARTTEAEEPVPRQSLQDGHANA